MDSQMRNIFADLHEIPELDSTLGEMAAVGKVKEVVPLEDKEETPQNHSANSKNDVLTTEAMFARDDKLEDSSGTTSKGKSHAGNKHSKEMDLIEQDIRRSSRKDIDTKTYIQLSNLSKNVTNLSQKNVIPSLRRSSRATKGVSKEVFDPSHISKQRYTASSYNQASPNRRMKTSSYESDENKRRKISDDRTKKQEKQQEDPEYEEESDSDSDDEYNDPNKLWCICKKPHNGRFMISCDVCEEWYHGDCVGVTVQRGKQMEKKGEEYVCPTCLGSKGKKVKPSNESGYESSKNKSGVNLKGYAHGKKLKRPQKKDGKPLKKRRIREGTENPKTTTDTQSQKNNGERRCVVSNCTNKALADSIYCSNVCILRHAKESLTEIAKSKQKTARTVSTDDKRETKEERIIRKIKEAASKGKVAVYCRKTGKIFANASAPFKKDLQTFLKNNPTYQTLKPPKHMNQDTEKKSQSGTPVSHNKPHNTKPHRIDSYSRDPEYKPEEKKSNPYKQFTPATGGTHSTKHKIDRQESQETKKKKHKKSLDHERRLSTDKAQKISSHKRENRSQSEERPERKEENTEKDKEVRKNVRKTLLGILQNRSNNSEDLKMHPDSITRLVNKIEDSLFKAFSGITSKYKNRYRSIMFNLKDEKNHGLWRKVILGEVTSSSLVKMTPEEMASKELAQWRKHELTAELEMIQELEVSKQNIRPVAKITHKGEIAINEDFSDLTETHLDKSQDSGGPSIAPHRVRRISANQPEISLDLPNITSDTTTEHSNHLFDLNCRICTGQVKEEDVLLDEVNQKKVKRSTSIILSNEAQSTVKLEQTDEEILKKISDFNKNKESFSIRLSSSKDEDDSPSKDSAGEDMAPESPQNDVVSEIQSPVKRSSSTESETRKDKKKELSGTTSKLSREHYLWTGIISMPELSSFRTNAYTVSGNCRELMSSIPAKLVLDGRIHPKVVWEYLAKVSTFPNKEICIVQFRASSEDDRVGYVSMLSYFSSRRRFGVVSNQNTQVIKDIYLVPLLESDSIPKQLLPFKGPGILKDHPSMLLGVIVRCIPETVTRILSTELESVKKLEEKSSKIKSDGDLDLSTKSLLDRNKLLTAPMAHFMPNSSSVQEVEEEEYNPETANFGDLDDVDLPKPSPKPPNQDDDDEEAYDPEKVVFDDPVLANEEDAPYDPEDDAERMESDELRALQEKQALLEKMRQELEMKKAELAKEEISLQVPPPPPPPKTNSKPPVDPRIAKRMNSDKKNHPAPIGESIKPVEESPLQKIFSVLNFDRAKTS